MREVLFEERKKDGRGTRLQKKGIGENVVGASVGGGTNQAFESLRRVSDSWNPRRTTQAHPPPCLAEGVHSIEPQIRAGSARFENARQVNVECGDRNMYGEFVRLSNLFQQVEVTNDEIRFGDDAKFKAAMKRELVQNCASDFVAVLGRLVGIGSSAERNGFV